MKKNICIIVLLLCVIGLGGYLSYDKFFKEEKEVEKSDKNLAKNKDTVDERYKSFIDNYKNEINNEKTEIDKWNEGSGNASDSLTISKYFICRTDDATEFNAASDSCNQFGNDYDVVLLNGKLTVNYKDEELKSIFGKVYLIATDVWNFEMVYTGNGGFRNLYFIKNDGTVGMANVELGALDKKIEIENNYKGYKNIVNILEGTSGGGSYAMFIDINGNINIG